MLQHWACKVHSPFTIRSLQTRPSSIDNEQTQRGKPTFLAVAGGPTAVFHLPVDTGLGLDTGLLHIQNARTHVRTLLCRFVVQDNVLLQRVGLHQTPVNGGDMAELLVPFNAHRTVQNIGQAVEADVTQVWHFKDHQGIVEEEAGPTDDGEVREEVPQALQPVDPEEEQILCDHDEAGETEVAEVLTAGGEHQQDLQVAFNDSAVLQLMQLGTVHTDIHALADCRNEKAG